MPTFDVAALIYNGLRKVTPSNPQSRAKCGRVMQLALPPGLDAEDGARLAGLVLCDLCSDNYPKPPQPEARAVRLPYADE